MYQYHGSSDLTTDNNFFFFKLLYRQSLQQHRFAPCGEGRQLGTTLKRRVYLCAMLMSFYFFSKMTEQSSTTRTVESALNPAFCRCQRRRTAMPTADAAPSAVRCRLCHLRNINSLRISQPTRPAVTAGRFWCRELDPSLKAPLFGSQSFASR